MLAAKACSGHLWGSFSVWLVWREQRAGPLPQFLPAILDLPKTGGGGIAERHRRVAQWAHLHDRGHGADVWIALHHSKPATQALGHQCCLSGRHFVFGRVRLSAQSHKATVRRDYDPAPLFATDLVSRHHLTMTDTRPSRKAPSRPSFTDVPDARRRNLAAVKHKDTRPELTVRKLLHAMGYRYRLHRRDLPGTPDIVLPGRRAVIEVMGCFWHQHPDETCRNAALPRTRTAWWSAKLARNRERDQANQDELEAAGWKVLILWECEVRDNADRLAARLRDFLGDPGTHRPANGRSRIGAPSNRGER